MYKLGILSRDYHLLEQLISNAQPTNLEIVFAQDNTENKGLFSLPDLLLADPGIAADVIDHFQQLRWMQSTWAGVSPMLSAKRRDYLLTGVKEVFGSQMSEFVFSYLLHFSRDIEYYQNRQREKRWQPGNADGLEGKTLGIMGMGSIGTAVAKTAKHFGMTVRGLSRQVRTSACVDQSFELGQLKQFCHQLDYLVCLLPDTPDTRHLIDQRSLSYLPSHCVLINAGRGSLIEQQALLDALNRAELRAAVLDVFEQEPDRKSVV